VFIYCRTEKKRIKFSSKNSSRTPRPTSPTGTSPVASGGGLGGQPPPPPMGGVGGSGMVRARIAALEAATGAVGGAATGAVASRTFPVYVRTTTVDVGTQTDHMVFPFVFPGGGWTL
jgi:hypothetical protein